MFFYPLTFFFLCNHINLVNREVTKVTKLYHLLEKNLWLLNWEKKFFATVFFPFYQQWQLISTFDSYLLLVFQKNHNHSKLKFYWRSFKNPFLVKLFNLLLRPVHRIFSYKFLFPWFIRFNKSRFMYIIKPFN